MFEKCIIFSLPRKGRCAGRYADATFQAAMAVGDARTKAIGLPRTPRPKGAYTWTGYSTAVS